MVGLFFLLLLIYYSSVFNLFLFFYSFKILFQIKSNSPKIIFQSIVRQYLAKHIVYLLILQFIGMLPSVMFYIKFCLIVNAPLIKCLYAVIFLFLNLLVSVFFYLQFYKKWNAMTAQEHRQVSFFKKKITHTQYNSPNNKHSSDLKKKYILTFFVISFILFNFLAPFYFIDFFNIIYFSII